MSTSNTYISMLPGGRKFWAGLLAGLCAIVVIASITLEDYACGRYSLCLVSQETLTRIQPLSPQVAIVELQTVRSEAVVEAADSNVLITGPGTTGLMISAEPIAQETRLVLNPANADDLRSAMQRLQALPAATLAKLTRDHAPLLKAHETVFEPLEQSFRRSADLANCADLDAAGWRLVALSHLGEQPDSTMPVTLSLLSVAMDCDESQVPGVAQAGRG